MSKLTRTTAAKVVNPERTRLAEDEARTMNWKRWGPYLAERQWGTVREDYSPDGEAWGYFSHEQACSRAYRWGEDGLMGITDREGRLCFSVALWNGRDALLKERLFGLSNPEGNHGEDVKEEYFYLDANPTHSYLKGLYKYPQAAFPYAQLREENKRRNRLEREFELVDTGVFDQSRYFDVQCEYAKNAPDDILIRITVTNRGPEAASVHVLPTLWYRNVWSWGCTHEGCEVKPRLAASGAHTVACDHPTLGHFTLQQEDAVPLLFTENETNTQRLFNSPNATPYVKDAFHDYVVRGNKEAVNPLQRGTKCAAHHKVTLAAGEARVFRLRLHSAQPAHAPAKGAVFGKKFDAVFDARLADTDALYAELLAGVSSEKERAVARQAYAGLLWSKQFYHYVVKEWLEGDSAMPPPPEERKNARNAAS